MILTHQNNCDTNRYTSNYDQILLYKLEQLFITWLKRKTNKTHVVYCTVLYFKILNQNNEQNKTTKDNYWLTSENVILKACRILEFSNGFRHDTGDKG